MVENVHRELKNLKNKLILTEFKTQPVSDDHDLFKEEINLLKNENLNLKLQLDRATNRVKNNHFADSPKSSIPCPFLSFLAAAGALKGTDATSCMQSLSLMNINVEFLVLSFEGKGFI
jgi:hypothetical protein